MSGAVSREEAAARAMRRAGAREAEAARIAEIKAGGARPDGAGEGVSDCAPARGPSRLYDPVEIAKTDSGGFRVHHLSGHGARPLKLGDAFDVMEAKAAIAAKKHKKNPERLFTKGQVEAGRTYAQLVERHVSAGARCSSVEGRTDGGGAPGDFMDALVAEGRRIDRIVAAIGPGWAIEPARAAPHGDRRRAIRVRTLVEMVCLQDRTLTDILQRHGWVGNTKQRRAIKDALCAALDRMQGL